MSKPSIPGMGHPSTPGNPNKRPRIGSAADLVVSGDDRPIRTIERFMADWKEYENEQKMDSDMIKAVDEEWKSLKKLQEYRDQHKDETVKAVALSSLEHADLLRMNVNACKDAVPINLWESLTRVEFDSKPRAITHKQIDECWDRRKDATEHQLTVITGGVPNQPEPFSRMMIDPVLLLLLEVINEEGTGILFVEFAISKGTDFPTCIKWTDSNGKKFTTFLTGRVDYLLLVYHGLQIAGAKDAVQTTSSEDRSCLKAFVKSKSIRGVWNFTHANGLQGVVFEAKVEETTGLIDHLPQVVGECLVTRMAVPWCLTTGKTWIFGVAIKNSSDPRIVGYTVHHAEPISWTIEAEREQVTKRAFMMLAFWATMRPQDVENFAARLPKPTTV
ncbi:hypothetical protein BDN72DRAFT_851836 [Pluteus cervinus]|uniref:Uncharacterized protein n=1 Tax=Pluteus cervinus TaxID=181527 RepID=A0ACD2ZXK8_9AGAR|nr:hypothetical protein BDN72DRAFT_851836 [Pluteus cervinus]